MSTVDEQPGARRGRIAEWVLVAAAVVAIGACTLGVMLDDGPPPEPRPTTTPSQSIPVWVPVAPPRTTPPSPTPVEAYYRSCAEARAAGKAPIQRGQPGYRSELDRDGDGIACDK